VCAADARSVCDSYVLVHDCYYCFILINSASDGIRGMILVVVVWFLAYFLISTLHMP